jgi:hypothetical protein
VLIAVRPKACPSCQPAYGPLIMLDPRPGRPPAKPAPPTFSARSGTVYGSDPNLPTDRQLPAGDVRFKHGGRGRQH